MSKHPIVVVGGSLSGLRTAEQLRAAGWTGGIIVVGEESWLPYNRPPLSKNLLTGDIEPRESHASVELRRRKSVTDVEWRLGCRAARVDLVDRCLTLDMTEELEFSGLVIATGLRAARLPGDTSVPGRHALRTLDDCAAVRSCLRPGARVVIVGAGFIGCETAASAVAMGAKVTVIEGDKGPYANVVGAEYAAWLRKALTDKSEGRLRFVAGSFVDHFLYSRTDDGNQRIAGVSVTSGERFDADLVIEAVGAVPNTEWLQGNGLDLSDGVLCDSDMRTIGTDGVVAVGDVARFPVDGAESPSRRVEHWSIAGDMAKVAARTLVSELAGESRPHSANRIIPSFWSDVFDVRVQGVGKVGLDLAPDVLAGEACKPLDGLTLGFYENGELVGATLLGMPPNELMKYRQKIAA